ncbi:MAG: hypothetical protein WKF81_08210, partial [Thermomicrobiales bacterium]
MSERPINMSRRRFLKTSAGVGFGVIVAANGHKVVAQQGSPVAADYKESPLVAEQVAAGTLPAVAERMPVNPVVVTPNTSVGTYGGTWRTALVGGGDNAWLARTAGYDGLVRWNIEWSESIPNVAESYEISADAL